MCGRERGTVGLLCINTQLEHCPYNHEDPTFDCCGLRCLRRGIFCLGKFAEEIRKIEVHIGRAATVTCVRGSGTGTARKGEGGVAVTWLLKA